LLELAPTPTSYALLLRPDAPDRPLPLERLNDSGMVTLGSGGM